MTKVKFFILIVIFIVMCLFIGSYAYVRYFVSNITCVGNAVITNEKNSFRGVIGRKLSHGTGLDTILGTLYQNNKPVYKIERKIWYSYRVVNSRYQIKTEAIIKGASDNVDNQELASILSSEMYINKGSVNFMLMKAIGISGWMVYSSPVPLYFCKKSE